MRLLPDGRYEITNKRTGEKKIVTKEELPNYGLAPEITPEAVTSTRGEITPQAPQESGGIGGFLKGVGKFVAEPVVSTAQRVGRLAEFVGGELTKPITGTGSLAGSGQREQLPEQLQEFVYSPEQVEQKFGGETAGERGKQAAVEAAKAGADYEFILRQGVMWHDSAKNRSSKNYRELTVDDVIATGGTVEAVANLVKDMKGNIIGAAFLIELTELKGCRKIKDIPLFSLIRY